MFLFILTLIPPIPLGKVGDEFGSWIVLLFTCSCKLQLLAVDIAAFVYGWLGSFLLDITWMSGKEKRAVGKVNYEHSHRDE